MKDNEAKTDDEPQTPSFDIGDTMWFRKSMQLVEVMERVNDDYWRVERLDTRKSMLATASGLLPYRGKCPYCGDVLCYYTTLSVGS